MIFVCFSKIFDVLPAFVFEAETQIIKTVTECSHNIINNKEKKLNLCIFASRMKKVIKTLKHFY